MLGCSAWNLAYRRFMPSCRCPTQEEKLIVTGSVGSAASVAVTAGVEAVDEPGVSVPPPPQAARRASSRPPASTGSV